MRIRFVLSQIGQGLRRNLAMTISVILVTFVSLAFVGAGILLQMQVDRLKDDWYDRAQVAVFLCPSGSVNPTCASGAVSDEQREAIRGVLESDTLAPYINEIHFETREMAFDSFQEMVEGQAWAQRITADDMQESFRIDMQDPEQFEIVADEVEGRSGVDVVQDQRELLESLFQVMNGLTIMAASLAGVMIVAAVLLITTTIRLSAMSRSRETSIMRLVGASNLFIQLPFMLEGAIAALIGSGLAVAALWAVVNFGIQGWAADSIQAWQFIDTGEVWLIAPILVLIGLVLAVISSIVTLSRYTKV